MHPHVSFRLPSGALAELLPGDIIGRSDRAALCLSEPYISEAHAMVSLRSGELKLLALRGRFSVDGKPASQITLRAGQRIVLASRAPLVVEEVVLPTEVLALVTEGIAPIVLQAVCSLRVGSTVELAPGFVPDAAATFWTSGPQLYVRVGDEPACSVAEGASFEIRGRVFRIVAEERLARSHVATWESDEVGAPLHLIVSYDTVKIIAGAHRVTLDGISARIVSELAAVGAPVAWQEVAKEIWGREPIAEQLLRDRWDTSLARLRRKLETARLRTDLVHSTGAGQVELLLGPGDTMEDRM